MNDDLTRGLTMLADEAKPAPVDTYDVITRAKARTRNRRATAATAFATVAAVGALTVSLAGGGAGDSVRVGAPTDPAERLTQQLADIRGDVLSPDWHVLPADAHGPLKASYAGEEPLTFECADPPLETQSTPGTQVCQAIGQFEDGASRISLSILVASSGISISVPVTSIDDILTLPDKTRAGTYTSDNYTLIGYTGVLERDQAFPGTLPTQLMSATRPDGTSIIVNVAWTGNPSAPPFTDEQLLEFATALTY